MAPELLSLRPGAVLFVVEIGEPEANSLRVVVAEAEPAGDPEPITGWEASVATPVRATDVSRTFEIVWGSYVSYLVENESFATPSIPEPVGPGLRLVTSSPLLDFTGRTSLASAIVGTPRHWCLVGVDHIVHVIGTQDPTVRLLQFSMVNEI